MVEKLEPCPYCDFSENDVGKPIRTDGNPFVFVIIRGDGQRVTLYTDGRHFMGLPINYCPICGRNLKARRADND